MNAADESNSELLPQCANCGATLTGTHCVDCGQHQRESQRLEVRQILARFAENILDFDSAFLRTWLELTLRPGQVCREYVRGRRKTYMNPFGYFVLSLTITVILSAIATKLIPKPAGAVAEGDSNFETTLMLLLLIPLAVIWSVLFRRAGFNLAENYVFALYVLGHFIWVEILILSPMSMLVSERVLISLYCLTSISYVVMAATVFYQEPVRLVLLKVLVTVLLLAIAVIAVGAIGFMTGLIPMEK